MKKNGISIPCRNDNENKQESPNQLKKEYARTTKMILVILSEHKIIRIVPKFPEILRPFFPTPK